MGLQIFGQVSTEVWEDDSVRSSVWWPYEPSPDISYPDLMWSSRYSGYDFLKMLIRLLPKGFLWNMPLGEKGDYNGV